MSDELSVPIPGLAAVESQAAAAFTAGMAALTAPAAPAPVVAPSPVAAPAAPTAEPPPASPAAPELAPALSPTPDPTPAPAPVEAVPAAPAEPAPPTEAALDFASAEIVAAGAKIGLSPDDIQRLYRSTPADQRSTLLQRLGVTPATPEPAPLDPAALDSQLETYLTTRHPEGVALLSQYREATTRIDALSRELTAAEDAFRDAEALVRITSREGTDEMDRADAKLAHREARARLSDLKADIREARSLASEADAKYRNIFTSTRERVLAEHNARLAEARAAAAAREQEAAYVKQWDADLTSAVDTTFSTLGLDPAFKGTRPAKGAPPDLSFWSFCRAALLDATLSAPITDLRAFIASLGPAYKTHLDTVNRTQAAVYGRLAQQRSSVPGPAPGVPAVASPEAPRQFDGDLAALNERAAAQFIRGLHGMPS